MKKNLLFAIFASLFIYGCASAPINKEVATVNNTSQTLSYQLWEGFLWNGNEKKILNDIFSDKLFVEYIANNYSTNSSLKVWQIWWVNLSDWTFGYEFVLDENIPLYIRTSWKFKTIYSSWYEFSCDKNNKFYKEEKLWNWEIAFTCDWDTWQYKEDIAHNEFFPDTITDIVVEKNAIRWSYWERVETTKKWP